MDRPPIVPVGQFFVPDDRSSTEQIDTPATPSNDVSGSACSSPIHHMSSLDSDKSVCLTNFPHLRLISITHCSSQSIQMDLEDRWALVSQSRANSLQTDSQTSSDVSDINNNPNMSVRDLLSTQRHRFVSPSSSRVVAANAHRFRLVNEDSSNYSDEEYRFSTSVPSIQYNRWQRAWLAHNEVCFNSSH